MKHLNTSELSNVVGGGAWDDFWQGVGEWMAETAYSKENMRIMESDPADIRDENPNDPLL